MSMRCTVCHRPYEGPQNHFVCPHCGGSIESPVDLQRDPERLRRAIREGSSDGIWGYRDFFDVPADAQPVTMGEGGTPLIHTDRLGRLYGMDGLYLKNETLNPSGTYKDRFATVAMTLARAEGIREVAIGSAGNAAAAVAAYAAKAGMECYIMLPPGAVKERAWQNMAYGGHFIYGMGGVNDCVAMAEDGEAVFGWKNMCTTMMNNPLACDGYKTIAYEIARSMRFDVPDYVICPVGGGIIISKVYKGFEEMKALGLIDRLPKMVAVQAAGCAPLVKAYQEGRQATEKWENGSTIAFAIFDPVTFEGVTALDTVRRSGGLAIALPDEEILEAMRACAKLEAVIPEPASAATIAAAARLHREGVISGTDKVVCVLTGSGLRDLKLFSQENAQVPEVQPGDMEALRRAVAFYQKKGEGEHDA
ncbi:MAG: threonine synthase [Clostridiales bacterium]|nr:threonine synthase [Clostridiales bacterium]